MTDEELLQAIGNIKDRLDALDGTMADYHSLLSNHITDYSTKFGRLRAAIESSIENSKIRDGALHTKINAYKWSLILIASFTVISLGGFVTLAIWAIMRLLAI